MEVSDDVHCSHIYGSCRAVSAARCLPIFLAVAREVNPIRENVSALEGELILVSVSLPAWNVPGEPPHNNEHRMIVRLLTLPGSYCTCLSLPLLIYTGCDTVTIPVPSLWRAPGPGSFPPSTAGPAVGHTLSACHLNQILGYLKPLLNFKSPSVC